MSKALTINARCEYDRDTADHVLEQVSLGKTVSEACRDIGVNKGTFFGWVRKNVDGITERYDVARDLCLECRADELVQLADDAAVDPQRSKLMLHARMWELARLKPHKYGDRNKVELGGLPDGEPVQTSVRVSFVKS